MVTAGAHNAERVVKVLDGEGNEGIYKPTLQGNQAVMDDGDLEFHVVFHDVPGPEKTENFPPPLSFFYHVQFEEVQIEIKQPAWIVLPVATCQQLIVQSMGPGGDTWSFSDQIT